MTATALPASTFLSGKLLSRFPAWQVLSVGPSAIVEYVRPYRGEDLPRSDRRAVVERLSAQGPPGPAVDDLDQGPGRPRADAGQADHRQHAGRGVGEEAVDGQHHRIVRSGPERRPGAPTQDGEQRPRHRMTDVAQRGVEGVSPAVVQL